jgi:hypothetical protein
MAVDLHQVDVRKAIDEPARRHLAHTPEVIGIHLVNRSPGELLCSFRHGIEHLVRPIQIMHGAENEIEALPVLLHPRPSRGGMHRVVIQFDTRADLHLGIRLPQPLDHIKINARVIPIVISERDITQPLRLRRIHPRLQQLERVGLNAMPLRMRVIIRKQTITCHPSLLTPLRRGQKLLPHAQLRILRKVNLGDVDTVRGQLARGDRLRVLDVFLRIDEHRPITSANA